jgi:N-acetylglucosaminyl-diphospho-decaprenol L-rhamnosyltransferase
VTAPAVSAIVVNHRSAAEAAACAASLREAFRREGVSGEIVLVDCASGPEEVRALEKVPADARVFLDENRGYSGGVNAGLARAGGAKLLLVNADVVLLQGALTALLAAIENPRVGAAAPLCLWDSAGTLRLPAEAAPVFFGELGFGPDRFPAFARRTVSLWERGGDTRHLVGAALAARRDVFDRVGRFDERFPFEYEETEWEERVRRAGLALRYEPRACARHLFARSARRNPETEARRAASRRRYREKRWGKLGRWVLERAANRPPRRRVDADWRRMDAPELAARNGAWVAVSTNPSLVPFAGAPLAGGFRLPEDVLGSLGPGTVYMRSFDPGDGRALETFVWEKP